MKVGFGKTEEKPVVDVESTPVAPETPAPANTTVVDATPVAAIPSNAVIPRPPQAVATTNTAPGGYNDEDIGFDDIILPRLNMVHGVGPLSEIFSPGEYVLNGTMVIHTPANAKKNIAGQPPLNVTVLGFKKRQYAEKTVGGKQGNLFNTVDEVVRANGTLDYKEAQSTNKTLYHTLATALILIQKPDYINDPEHLIFAHECEGKFYSLALWSMKSTAYTHAAKHIFTARKMGHLKAVKDDTGRIISGGYPSFSWSLTSELDTKFENPTNIPVLKAGGRNTPAFLKFVEAVLTDGN